MSLLQTATPFPVMKISIGTPLLLLMLLSMIVIPLPPLMLDVLFTFNMSLSLVILLVVIYSQRPLDFSSFPSVLLLATLIRLALNVASTRVILLEGHTGTDAAGEVISSFGEFVIGGNYAVGLVVFAVLVIINFVVVTKGAGRISEVSARFILDALPGKQMSIDADLGAGIIDADAARARRVEITREADFYGAMDGASKFVRGDAIAGILIVMINIFCGFIIGMLQHQLSFTEAVEVYALLTIGDGLVAQIPSLVLSTAAALMVTRVSDSHDIGQQIMTQLFGGHRALAVTAVMVGSMGLIPGMPNLQFIVIAIMAGSAAWLIYSRNRNQNLAAEGKRKTEITTPSEEVNWETVTPLDAISLEVGYRIIPLVDKTQGGELMVRVKGVRKKLTQELGFLIPTVHVRDNLSLPPDEYRISFQGSLVGQGTVYINRQMAINPGKVSGSIPGMAATDPAFGLPAVWIDSASREQAQLLGYTVVDPATVIATHICQLILQYSHELLSYQDTREILDQLARTMPKLVEDLTPKALPLTIIHKVLQNLLREHISIRDIRTIAECLSEHASRSQQTAALTAATRIALGRSILQQINGLDPELTVITLEPVLEQLLLQSVQKESGEVNAEPVLVDRLSERIGEKTRRLESLGHVPVLLVSPQLRPWLAQLIRYVTKSAHVLSFMEIPEGKRIKVLDSIGVESALQQDKRHAR